MLDTIMSYVSAIIDFIWVPPSRQHNERPHDVAETKPKAKSHTRKIDSFVDGNHKSISELLESLDELYALIRRIKPKGDEAVSAMKNIGIYAYGTMQTGMYARLPRHVIFPSVFAVHIKHKGSADGDEDLLPAMYWGNKIQWNRSMGLKKPASGWFYEFGGTFLMDGKTYEMFTWIDVSDRQPKILKRRVGEYVNVGKTQYHHRKWERVTLPSERKNVDLVDHTETLFCLVLNLYLSRACGTEVHVTKNKQRIVFTVPEHRWKDFFADRVVAKASDGRRKRIFHHVAAHYRADGTFVPMHTRGQTKFSWKGYDVRIVEQKEGRISVVNFESAGVVLDQGQDDSDFVLQGRASKQLLREATRDLHIPRN
jgi:hypothetical protein